MEYVGNRSLYEYVAGKADRRLVESGRVLEFNVF